MRTVRPAACVLLSVGLALAAVPGRTLAKPGAASYHPHIDPAGFRTVVDNPYFPLVPGTVFKFIERAGRHTSEDVVTVTRDTKVIMGVTCVVVHDVVREEGAVTEETFDWYAQDRQGSVWYFGEATKEFQAHGKVSTEGSWEAGVDGAQPGMIMPGHPAPGEPYRQEYHAGEAEDMGQVVAVNDSVTVPFGRFTGCVHTKEWSMLEPGTEKKWYAPGVGLVRTESTSREVATLVSVTKP